MGLVEWVAGFFAGLVAVACVASHFYRAPGTPPRDYWPSEGWSPGPNVSGSSDALGIILNLSVCLILAGLWMAGESLFQAWRTKNHASVPNHP